MFSDILMFAAGLAIVGILYRIFGFKQNGNKLDQERLQKRK